MEDLDEQAERDGKVEVALRDGLLQRFGLQAGADQEQEAEGQQRQPGLGRGEPAHAGHDGATSCRLR